MNQVVGTGRWRIWGIEQSKWDDMKRLGMRCPYLGNGL